MDVIIQLPLAPAELTRHRLAGGWSGERGTTGLWQVRRLLRRRMFASVSCLMVGFFQFWPLTPKMTILLPSSFTRLTQSGNESNAAATS